jgi:hypothetical protein
VQFFVLQPRNVDEPALIELFEQAKKVLQIILVDVNEFLDAFCDLFVLELFFGLFVLLLRNGVKMFLEKLPFLGLWVELFSFLLFDF